MPTVKILGDVHLGRRFVNNVPLHRRGDREKDIQDQFIRELRPDGANVHVCMGDLFDHAEGIPYGVIRFAADTYIQAAAMNPNTEFVILQGNHDAGRDLTVTTAFDLFQKMVKHVKNIVVVTGWHRIGNHIFFAWQPSIEADTFVERCLSLADGVDTAWGHWDVDLRSPSHNLIPTETLARYGIGTAYTGHVHKAATLSRDGVDVIVTGSMTGLAHGEGHPYVTLTLDELEEKDPDELKDLCLRIRLRSDETIEEIPDCLQWQVEQTKAEQEAVEVEIGDFDLSKVYKESFDDLEISKSVRQRIDSRWQTTFTKPG